MALLACQTAKQTPPAQQPKMRLFGGVGGNGGSAEAGNGQKGQAGKSGGSNHKNGSIE